MAEKLSQENQIENFKNDINNIKNHIEDTYKNLRDLVYLTKFRVGEYI